MKRFCFKYLYIVALILSVCKFNSAAAQVNPKSGVLENALAAVVTVGVFETDPAKKTLGFRGDPSDMAYAKMLDLSGASGTGSGFFIRYNNKAYVITNAHVVEQATDKQGSISVFTINRKKYNARIVGGDSFYDIAVLEMQDTPGDEISYLTFRDSEAQIGERVFAIGNPLGEYPYSISDGIISAKNRIRGGLTGKFGYLQSTATVIWGNSGGPLVDFDGNVLGINSQIAFANRDGNPIWQPQINFALEAALCQRLINDILSNKGIVKRAFFGMEVSQNRIAQQEGTKAYAYHAKIYTVDDYPILTKVLDHSPAVALNAYIGQQIVAVNKETVRNMEEVLGELEKCKPGQKATFTFKKAADGDAGTKYIEKEIELVPSVLNAAKTADIGASFLRSEGVSYREIQKNLVLRFASVSKNKGALKKPFSKVASETEKVNNFDDSEWEVVGMGILEEDNTSVWRVNSVADAGAALRLTGLAGMIDILLFRKDSNPDDEDSYVKKRLLLSGEVNLNKQTLWY